jgi:predicted secreted hydrolase
MKERFENQEVGSGTNWKKELEAWILNWNILQSINNPTT